MPHHDPWELRRYPHRVEVPSAQLLQVSKAIRDEATPILYSGNVFTTASISDSEWDHVFDMFLGQFEGPRTETPSDDGIGEAQVRDMWVAAHSDLVRDIGKISDADIAALPTWLFTIWGDWPIIDLEVVYRPGLGCQYPAFLRQIGQKNTAMIEKVEILFGDLIRGADYFPIYAEILRQYFPKLRLVLVGKLLVTSLLPWVNTNRLLALVDFNCINNYGSDRNWNTSNEYGMKGREQYTDDAVMALFGGLRA